jgi:2-phospho-L-lactate guanylyltransferase (CobY/MobA/RfbA family)
VNTARQSYEARVLLVPLGAHAMTLSTQMAAAGLDGIMALHPDFSSRPYTYQVQPLASVGWAPATSARAAADVVAEADMVVLLAADLAQVSDDTCREVSRAAQDNGVLIAALVVGSAHCDTPAGNNAMVVLRESADMLVVVRSLRLATPFIDVLRGGQGQPARRS